MVSELRSLWEKGQKNVSTDSFGALLLRFRKRAALWHRL